MKLICVGRNYGAHAKELGNTAPEEPILFMKPSSAIAQPGRPVYYPDFTQDLHYECELIIKISRNGKHIEEKFAHKYFSEVSLGIDFTARDVQQRQKEKGLPWEIAKAFDGSAVVGQWQHLEGDIQNLNFELRQNGQVVQQGFTGDMIFTVHRVLAYASKFFTLQQGDILFTGTPAGVGPVALNDFLEAYLEGKKVLEVQIR